MKYFTLSCVALLVCSAAFSNDLLNPVVAKITLTGQVYCNNSKNPIASSIHVKVEGTDPIHLTVAPNGKFTAHLPKGDHIQIVAEADGYESNEMTYSIPNTQ